MLQRTPLLSANQFNFSSKKPDDEKMLTVDTFDATKKLEDGIKAAGGLMVFNAMFRSWAKQQSLVDLHTKDPVHNAFAAPPGGSFHQAGRSLDFDLQALHFPNIPQTQWLQKLWDIAKPLGFRPIVDKPDMTLPEAWHFDFVGPWQAVHDHAGNATAAKCAILDVGNWNPNESSQLTRNMFIQAQLLRLGRYEIGAVDGAIGPKSIAALNALGISENNLDEAAQCLLKK